MGADAVKEITRGSAGHPSGKRVLVGALTKRGTGPALHVEGRAKKARTNAEGSPWRHGNCVGGDWLPLIGLFS